MDPWIGENPWRRAWQPTPVFLNGESHGQRSLVGYSPWGHKESNMTEGLRTVLLLFTYLYRLYKKKKNLKDFRIFSAIHCSVFDFVLVS